MSLCLSCAHIVLNDIFDKQAVQYSVHCYWCTHWYSRVHCIFYAPGMVLDSGLAMENITLISIQENVSHPNVVYQVRPSRGEDSPHF